MGDFYDDMEDRMFAKAAYVERKAPATGFSFDFSKDKPRDPEELATALARIEAHAVFDWLWKFGPYSRRDAYRWLAAMLGKTAVETHIKQFDEATCKRVINLAKDLRDDIERRAFT